MATNVGNIITDSGNNKVSIKQAGESSDNNKVLLTTGVTLSYEWGSDTKNVLYNTTYSTASDGTISWTSKWKHNHNTLGSIGTSPTLTVDSNSVAKEGGTVNVTSKAKLVSNATDTRKLRYQDIKYVVSYAGISKTFSSYSDADPKGIFQTYYNSPNPELTTSVSSNSSWVHIKTKPTTVSGTSIDNEQTFKVTVDQNVPQLSGSFSGDSNILISGISDTSHISPSAQQGTLSAKLTNYKEDIDDSNTTATERTATITANYTTQYSSTSVPSKSVTITQAGGNIAFERPTYSYVWSSDSSWLSLSSTTGDSVTVSLSYNGGEFGSVAGSTTTVTYDASVPLSGGTVNVTLATNAASKMTAPTNTSNRIGTVKLKTVSKSDYITASTTDGSMQFSQYGVNYSNPSIKVTATSENSLGSKSATYNASTKTWNASNILSFAIPSETPTDSDAAVKDADPIFYHPSFTALQSSSDLYDTTTYGFTATAGHISSIADKQYVFDLSVALGDYTKGSSNTISPSKISVTRKGQSGTAWQYSVPTVHIGANPATNWLDGTFNTDVSFTNYPTATDSSHGDKTFNSSNVLTLSTSIYPKTVNKGSVSFNTWDDLTLGSGANTLSVAGPTFTVKQSSQRNTNVPVTFNYVDENGVSQTIEDTINIKQTGSSGSATVTITSNSSDFKVSNNTGKSSGANYSITYTKGNEGSVSGTMTVSATKNGGTVSGNKYTFPYDYSGDAVSVTLGGLTYTNGASKTGTLTGTFSASNDLTAQSSKTINVTQLGQTVGMTPYSSFSSSFVTTSKAFSSNLTSSGTTQSIFAISPNYGTNEGSITGTVGISPSSKTNIANTGAKFSVTGTLSNFVNNAKTKSSEARSTEITYGIKFTGTTKSDVTGKLTIYQEGQTVESVPSTITYLWSVGLDSTTNKAYDWIHFYEENNINNPNVTIDHNHGSISGQLKYSSSIHSFSEQDGIDYPDLEDNFDGISSDNNYIDVDLVIDSYTNTLKWENTSTRNGYIRLTESIGSFWSSSKDMTVSQLGYTYDGTPDTLTYYWSVTTSDGEDWARFVSTNTTSSQESDDVVEVDDNYGYYTGSLNATVGYYGFMTSFLANGGSDTLTGTLSVTSDTLKAVSTSKREFTVTCDSKIDGFYKDTAKQTVIQLGDTITRPAITYSWRSFSSWIKSSKTNANACTFTIGSNYPITVGNGVTGYIWFNKPAYATVIAAGATSKNNIYAYRVVPNVTVSVQGTNNRVGYVALTERIGSQWSGTSKPCYMEQKGSPAPSTFTYNWTINATDDWLYLNSASKATDSYVYICRTSNFATVSGSVKYTASLNGGNTTGTLYASASSNRSANVTVANYTNTVVKNNKPARTGTISCTVSMNWDPNKSWTYTYTSYVTQSANSVQYDVSDITYSWTTSNSSMITFPGTTTASSVSYNITSNYSTLASVESLIWTSSYSTTVTDHTGGTVVITNAIPSWYGSDPESSSDRSGYVYCTVTQYYPSSRSGRNSYSYKAATRITQYGEEVDLPHASLLWETSNDNNYYDADMDANGNWTVDNIYTFKIPAATLSGKTTATTKPYSGSAYKFCFNTSSGTLTARIAYHGGSTYQVCTYYFTQTVGSDGGYPEAIYVFEPTFDYIDYSQESNPDVTLPSSFAIKRPGTTANTTAAPAFAISSSNLNLTGVPAWAAFSKSSTITFISSSSSDKTATGTSSRVAVSGLTFNVAANNAKAMWSNPTSTSGSVTASQSSSTTYVASSLCPTSSTTPASARSTTICVYNSSTYIGAMRIYQYGSATPVLKYNVTKSTGDGWSVNYGTSNINAGVAWSYTAPASNEYHVDYKYTYTTTHKYTYTTPYSVGSSWSQSFSSDSSSSGTTSTSSQWNNTTKYWKLNVTIPYTAGTVTKTETGSTTSKTNTGSSTVGSTATKTATFNVVSAMPDSSGTSVNKTITLTKPAYKTADTATVTTVNNASVTNATSYPSLTVTATISNTTDFNITTSTTTVSGGTTLWNNAVVSGNGDAFSTKSTTLTVTFKNSSGTTVKTITATMSITPLTWTAHNS